MFAFKLFLGLCCSTGCYLIPSSNAETRNLALQQSATSNSELQPVYRAIDEDESSCWESEFGIDDVQLTVDLGDIYQLQDIVLNWGTANAQDFVLQTSNDLADWAPLAMVTDASVRERTDTFGNLDLLDIRYRLHENDRKGGVSRKKLNRCLVVHFQLKLF